MKTVWGALRILSLTAIVLLPLLFSAHVRLGEAEEPSATSKETLLSTDPFLALAARADAVIVAWVESRRSYWSPRHDRILTDYVLRTVATLHGTAPPRITLTEEGGEVGDVGLLVSDAVVFEPNERYAVLLQAGLARPRVLGADSGVRKLQSANSAFDPIVRSLETVLAPAHGEGSAR